MPPYKSGYYTAKILEADYGRAGTGTAFFFLRCLIQCIYRHGRVPQPCAQDERTVYLYLTKPAANILNDALDILGVTRDQIKPGSPERVNLAGRQVVLRCTHEIYEDKPRERWRLVRPQGLGGGAGLSPNPAPPTADEIAALFDALPTAPWTSADPTQPDQPADSSTPSAA